MLKLSNDSNAQKSKIECSALAAHCKKVDPYIDFEGAKAIDIETNNFERMLLDHVIAHTSNSGKAE